MAVVVKNTAFKKKKNIVLAVWRHGMGSCLYHHAQSGAKRRREAIASLVHDMFISGLGTAAR